MRHFSIVSTLLVLSLIASPAVARPWARLAIADNNAASWVDVGSITEDAGQRIAWLRQDLRRPERDGTVQTLTRRLFDCRRRESALVAIVSYDRQGRSTYSGRAEDALGPEFTPVVPDSVGEAVMNFVCSYPIGIDPREISGLQLEN